MIQDVECKKRIVISDRPTKEIEGSMNSFYCDAKTNLKVECSTIAGFMLVVVRNGVVEKEIFVGHDTKIEGGFAAVSVNFDPIAPFAPDWI